VLAGAFAYHIQDYIHSPISTGETVYELTIDKGASFNQVNQQLADSGVISNPFYFKLLAMYEEHTQDIKTGEYQFVASQTPAQVLEDLVNGKTIQHSLTIVEGKTFLDFLDTIQQHPKIKQTVTNIEQIKKQLGIERDNLEGLFLPDTYQFTAGTSDIEILKQSYLLLRKLLNKEWPQRDEQSYVSSPYEALILASIVEKESAVAEERTRIAGVFISRLKIGMRLQTDPTVIYGIGEDFDGNITRKHLETDTPYNTYTRYGLPPSPISLPSKAAILAVLHPEITGELFFVAKGDGSHHFSKTYEEHRAAVHKYQLKK
jgi:UPF0755 protein